MYVYTHEHAYNFVMCFREFLGGARGLDYDFDSGRTGEL